MYRDRLRHSIASMSFLSLFNRHVRLDWWLHAPDDGIAGWWVVCAGEITSKTSKLDDVVTQGGAFGRRAIVRDQFIEQVLIEIREGLCRRRVRMRSIEHGDPKESGPRS